MTVVIVWALHLQLTFETFAIAFWSFRLALPLRVSMPVSSSFRLLQAMLLPGGSLISTDLAESVPLSVRRASTSVDVCGDRLLPSAAP